MNDINDHGLCVGEGHNAAFVLDNKPAPATANKERCACPDWEEGCKDIDSLFVIAHIHGFRYTTKVFAFCPWCGNKFPAHE